MDQEEEGQSYQNRQYKMLLFVQQPRYLQTQLCISTTESIKEGKPVIKSNSELIEKLHLENKSVIDKLMTLQKVKD